MSSPPTVPLLDLKPQYRALKAEIDAAIARVVESQQFILGPEVEGLEKELAAYCRVSHAVGCSSGTDALLLALIGMDDAGLRREFDTHADLAADDKGERRMSKAGLASFMHGQGLAHGDAEVERFLARVDANNDGEIDFSEFRALARSNSDLPASFRGLRGGEGTG